MSADWSYFNAAAYAYDPAKADILKPFRDEVLDHGIPWELGRTTLMPSSVRVLLWSMAAHAQTQRELRAVFDGMDGARKHGMPMATSDAGDVLIDRAKGKRGYPPLPEFWEDVALAASARGKDSSAAYWAASMLRAAGHHLPHQEKGEPDRGVA